ncbi:MAG: aldo/keto reductase [Dehalococcoidia bacterium]
MRPFEKRRLGRTDLMVTELGFGAMNIPDVREGEETLGKALELGINFIDTARIYRGSEYLIGKVIEGRRRDSFIIATKTPRRSRDGALNDLDKSLKTLGIGKIDLYQLHDVSPVDWNQVMGKEGAVEGLKEAREQGLIDHIGLTSHTLEVLEKALDSGEFETVLLKYSPFERETRRIISRAKERDVGVIVMKPLGGLGMPATLRGYETPLDPETLLRYVLSNPSISVVIPGARFPWEVEENVALARSYEPMASEEIGRVDDEADALLGKMAIR